MLEQRKGLWNILKTLKGKVTVILTSHYLDEVEALADRIAIIDKGNLKAIGRIEELKEQTKLDKLEDIFLSVTKGKKVMKTWIYSKRNLKELLSDPSLVWFSQSDFQHFLSFLWFR